MPFLARLYYDGEFKKLGLISLKDTLVSAPNQDNRIWPAFIYTVSNPQELLREAISDHCLRTTADNGSFQITQAKTIDLDEPLTLRPARPLDQVELRQHHNEMPQEFREMFFH